MVANTNLVLPDSPLNSDVPQRVVSDTGTNVNVILPSMHSPSYEKSSDVNPTATKATTTHVSSPNSDSP